MDSKGKGALASKIVSHVLVVLWMGVIFCFTAQTGDESGNLSSGFTQMLVTGWNDIFRLGWNETQILAITESLGYPIRKMAHMTEFGVLAVLIWSALKYYTQINTMKKHYTVSWIAAVGYAMTDESHQLFVEGRSGNLFDVGVDAAGAFVALVLVYGIRLILTKIRKR